MRKSSRYALCPMLTLGIFMFEGSAAAAESRPMPRPTVRLALNGQAPLPVIVPANASMRIRGIAGTLADYLGRISGARFVVETGDGQTGIAIGTSKAYPLLGLQAIWDGKDPTRREDYLLRSHAKGLQVIGATELAVEYAVWDLLYRLGHRQFFPGPTWEVVPRTADLAIAVHTREHPSFVSRDVGFGFGPWDGRGQPYAEWCIRNRMAAAGSDRPILESGHAYGQIMADLKDEFAKHPEYLALVNGKRQPAGGEAKFCIGNPDLRRLVARYATDSFARLPEACSITLEPSDGLGWCECERCRALGSVSDRVATLLNEAAAAIRAKYGSKKLISIYAYAEHAAPPHIKVDPQVVVNVATCMTLGNFTTDELIDGWRKQGAQIGIREYYGVYPWDRDLPGQPRMADRRLLKESIMRFYQKGARFLVAESSDDWGVTGLGYYLTARMLWDVREADRINALTDDFLDKAFGRARKPMAEFYRLIDAACRPRLSSDLLGRMYRTLDEARKLAGDLTVVARVNDLVLYARYVELYREYASAHGAQRQRAVESLFRFTYRMRRTGMVHSLAVWRGLPYYDQATFRLPPGVGYETTESKDPWKENKPIDQREIEDFLSKGVARHGINGFASVNYSKNLVPVRPLALPVVPTGAAGLYFRNSLNFYTWSDEKPVAVPLTVKAGLIYQMVGDARLSLFRDGEADAVTKIAVLPDQKEHAIRLLPRASGLHRIEFSDRSGGTILSWPAGTPWTIPTGQEEGAELQGRWTLYFYVPKRTKVVAGYADGLGDLLDSSGKKVCTFSGPADYFCVPVAPGQDGRLWKFADTMGQRVLLTVPPYLARDSRELLLPAEVIRADSSK